MDQFSTILQGTHGYQEGHLRDFLGGSVVKNLPANADDKGSVPGPGRPLMPQRSEARCTTTTAACSLEPVLHNKRSHCNEKSTHCN